MDSTGRDPELGPDSRAGSKPRWDVSAQARLRDYLDSRDPALHLQTFDEVADTLRIRFGTRLREDMVPDQLLTSQQQSYGMLDYQKLHWLSSQYLKWSRPLTRDATSTVLSFRPTDNADPSKPSQWREYLLLKKAAMDDATFDELATVFDVLALHAQRRMLLSVSAQRRLYKIALPWGHVRFKCRSESASREYMLLPILTLLSAGRTTQYRRTVSLTLFLLPNSADPRPSLTTFDLARLCQQSVWLPRRQDLPVLIGSDGRECRLPIKGPLASFIDDLLVEENCYLPAIFDAVMRKSLDYIGVDSSDEEVDEKGTEERVRARIAVSRMRSAIFGTSLHFDCGRQSSVWNHLMKATAERRADVVGSALSVNAGRDGKEWLIDGDALQFERMRVTNAFEEDTNALALYNPMSRFMLNIMPKDSDQFTSVSLAFGVAWLNLLAVTVCTVKEILRSYRHEIEVHRTDVMVRLRAANIRRKGQGGKPEDPPVSPAGFERTSSDEAELEEYLRDLHLKMLAIREEVDVVYGLELVGQAYKAAYMRMLEMESIPLERDRLLRELDMTAELLRAEQADKLSGEIAESVRVTKELNGKIALSVGVTEGLSKDIAAAAKATTDSNAEIAGSTRSTDYLTRWVVRLTIISAVLGINPLVDAFSGSATQFAIKAAADVAAVVALVIVEVVRRRRVARLRQAT